jgi:cobalt-zinc-cadmium efflux system outer membrane protein
MEIEIAGQRRKRIEEAESHLTRVEAEVADVERLLTARVEEAFYRTLYLRRRADLFGQVEELNRRMRDASEERFQSGEAAKSEANLGVVRHAQSRRDALAAARDHANAVRELEALIGAAPLGNTQPRGDLEAPAATRLAAQDLVETAWRARPDLRARDAELRRLAAQTALTRRLRVPNPTLSGFYDEEAESATGRDRIFGGAVSIPLPVFDRQQGEITALAGARLQAEHRKAAARLAVEAEVRQALAAYEAALATLRAFEAGALQRIDETFGLIESAYREGKIDLLQLVVAQNDLVGARFSHLDTLWDSWQARIALERAVGAPLEPGGDPPAGEPPVQP